MFIKVLLITVQKAEITQMSTKWWTDKQKGVYLHNGLFDNKKEWRTNTCYSMAEP